MTKTATKIFLGRAGINGPYEAHAAPEGDKRELADQIERMERMSCRDMERECGLKEWGKWARLHDWRLGYSTLPAFRAKGWGEPNLEEVIENINDEQAEPIDAAIASLPERHKEVIVAIYMYCIPWLKLPLIMGMGRRQIEFYQGQAVGIIWTKLNETKKRK